MKRIKLTFALIILTVVGYKVRISTDPPKPLAFFEPTPLIIESSDPEVGFSDIAVECAKNLIQKGLIDQSKMKNLSVTYVEFDSYFDEFWLDQEMANESTRMNFNASPEDQLPYYGHYFVKYELKGSGNYKSVQCSMSEEYPEPPNCEKSDHYHGSLYGPNDQELVNLTSHTHCPMALKAEEPPEPQPAWQ
jgi:hypothetical protein